MKYIVIAILLTACVLLYAENQLDVVWQMQSEQPSIDYGKYVISLDFNGDGIDDLVVNAYRYYINEEHQNQRGKLYVYYGSEMGLPDSPDMTISTAIDTSKTYIDSWLNLQNLGDMDGDECEEIGYRYSYGMYNGGYSYHHRCRILCGNTVNDTIPDYEYEVNSSSAEIHPLGDINGDGYDDAGITDELSNTLTYSIVYGGTFEKVTFVEGIYTQNQKNFRGLGDVNGDGFDDFSYHYEDDWNGEYHTYHNCFFFGDTVQDTIPDYHFVHETTVNFVYHLMPAGDWNGDGYNDFVFSGYEATDDGSTSPGCRLWRGGEIIHWDWYGYIEFYGYFNPSYGDLNGDGKGDLVDPYCLASGDTGYLFFYLGDQNGTWDYYGSSGEEGYGIESAHAVGDFNNDGYDDIAVGAYGNGGNSTSNWGYVFVYGGHEDLEEVDLDDTSDESVPPADVTFNAYPNPFNPEISFEIKTEQEYHDLKIEIYNVKGQKVETLLTPLRRGDKGGLSITWNAGDYASGVYFCKLNAGDNTLQTRKVTLMK